MTWQVLLVKLPDSLGSLGDLPEDYEPPALGEPDAVSERIVRAVAHADVRYDVAQNVVALRADDFVIEAELGGVASVDRVVLSVFGSDAAWPLVGDVARALGASAIDCETDVLLDPGSVVPATLREWQGRVEELR